MNFLMKMHGFTLFELDDMIPWEREVFINLLDEHLKKQQDEMDKEKARYHR